MPSALSSQLSSFQGMNNNSSTSNNNNHRNMGGPLPGLGNESNISNFFLPSIIPTSNQNQMASSLNDLDSLLPRPFPFSGNVQQNQNLSLQLALAQANGIIPVNPQISGLQLANLSQLSNLISLNSPQVPNLGGIPDTNNSALQNMMHDVMGQQNALNFNSMQATPASLNPNFPSSLNPLHSSIASQLADMLNNNANSNAQAPPSGFPNNGQVYPVPNVSMPSEVVSKESSPNGVTSPQAVRSSDEQAMSSSKKPLKAREARWIDRYNELVQFQKDHGHCRVPHGYTKNRKLAWWVMNQRAQFSHLKAGKKTWLTPERIQMLDDIGFVWYPHVKKANSNHKKKDAKESGSSDEEDAKPGAK
mmetsp:Transcript_2870/g.6166  ORF Transcript_2870/g.6166 Transcript_2870/m.6166 type:complete len:361 (+) Transcript_2870:1-1083(+)